MKEEERYFACLRCCKPITWTDILEDCGSGGQGMCNCQYAILGWNDTYQNFEPVYNREFIEYIEITKVLHDILKDMSVISRLRDAYIPESQIIEKPVYCDRCKGEIK